MSKTVSKFALAVSLVLAMALTFSCSSDDGDKDGGGSCNADFGEVTIGTQTWAAKNLNCNVGGSKCYNNDPANCAKYGRLYNWLTAMKSCPSGWHLPTQAEWNTLSSYVTSNGCSYCSAAYLQVTGFGFGTDDYSFSALPGGLGRPDGSFDYVRNDGYWWSASEDDDDSNRAWRWHMSISEAAIWNSGNKSSLFSVRCLQD